MTTIAKELRQLATEAIRLQRALEKNRIRRGQLLARREVATKNRKPKKGISASRPSRSSR